MAGTCECCNEPSVSIKCGGNFLTGWELVSFSRGTLLHGVSKKEVPKYNNESTHNTLQ